MLITKRNWKTIIFVNENGGMSSRVCTKCQKLRTAKEFGINSVGFDGKRPECIPCQNEKQGTTNAIRTHKFRAKKHGLPSTMTLELREKAKQEQGFKCILSGSKDIVTEHLVPLSWGTGFGDTYGNVIFMSQELNVSKGKKNIFEWIQTQPRDYQKRFYNVLLPMIAERNDMTTKEYETYVNKCYEAYTNNN